MARDPSVGQLTTQSTAQWRTPSLRRAAAKWATVSARPCSTPATRARSRLSASRSTWASASTCTRRATRSTALQSMMRSVGSAMPPPSKLSTIKSVQLTMRKAVTMLATAITRKDIDKVHSYNKWLIATTCCRRKNVQATRKKAVMMWPKRYRLHIPKKFAIRSQNRNVTVCPNRFQKRYDLVYVDTLYIHTRPFFFNFLLI